MFNRKWDSYGYDEPQAFVTLAEQKKLKFQEDKTVGEERTAVETFFSQEGTNQIDLVEPIIGE